MKNTPFLETVRTTLFSLVKHLETKEEQRRINSSLRGKKPQTGAISLRGSMRGFHGSMGERRAWSFDAHYCHMVTAVKYPVPDRIVVICNFWHPGTLMLRAERQSAQTSKITINPVWRRMLYNCTHMVTVGVSGLREHRGRGGTEWVVPGTQVHQLPESPTQLIR